ALLTNQKPESRARRLPSESPTPATPLIIYCTSVLSFSGWLLIFLACHWNTERHRIGCGQVVQHVCALFRRHTASPSAVKLSSASGLVHRTVVDIHSTLPAPHIWQDSASS
uniref:Frizzled domain-containing protein n=1 Tax=Mesocestoides corti TaxID=53468 RepID=A0A5K3G364_MESCO